MLGAFLFSHHFYVPCWGPGSVTLAFPGGSFGGLCFYVVLPIVTVEAAVVLLAIARPAVHVVPAALTSMWEQKVLKVANEQLLADGSILCAAFTTVSVDLVLLSAAVATDGYEWLMLE